MLATVKLSSILAVTDKVGFCFGHQITEGQRGQGSVLLHLIDLTVNTQKLD